MCAGLVRGVVTLAAHRIASGLSAFDKPSLSCPKLGGQNTDHDLAGVVERTVQTVRRDSALVSQRHPSRPDFLLRPSRPPKLGLCSGRSPLMRRGGQVFLLPSILAADSARANISNTASLPFTLPAVRACL